MLAEKLRHFFNQFRSFSCARIHLRVSLCLVGFDILIQTLGGSFDQFPFCLTTFSYSHSFVSSCLSTNFFVTLSFWHDIETVGLDTFLVSIMPLFFHSTKFVRTSTL